MASSHQESSVAATTPPPVSNKENHEDNDHKPESLAVDVKTPTRKEASKKTPWLDLSPSGSRSRRSGRRQGQCSPFQSRSEKAMSPSVSKTNVALPMRSPSPPLPRSRSLPTSTSEDPSTDASLLLRTVSTDTASSRSQRRDKRKSLDILRSHARKSKETVAPDRQQENSVARRVVSEDPSTDSSLRRTESTESFASRSRDKRNSLDVLRSHPRVSKEAPNITGQPSRDESLVTGGSVASEARSTKLKSSRARSRSRSASRSGRDETETKAEAKKQDASQLGAPQASTDESLFGNKESARGQRLRRQSRSRSRSASRAGRDTVDAKQDASSRESPRILPQASRDESVATGVSADSPSTMRNPPRPRSATRAGRDTIQSYDDKSAQVHPRIAPQASKDDSVSNVTSAKSQGRRQRRANRARSCAATRAGRDTVVSKKAASVQETPRILPQASRDESVSTGISAESSQSRRQRFQNRPRPRSATRAGRDTIEAREDASIKEPTCIVAQPSKDESVSTGISTEPQEKQMNRSGSATRSGHDGIVTDEEKTELDPPRVLPIASMDESLANSASSDVRGKRNIDRARSRSRSRNGREVVQELPLATQVSTDESLCAHVAKDPRGTDPSNRIESKSASRGSGRNTESFDPASTLTRPDLRIHVGSNAVQKFDKVLKHDDVVMVPELFGREDNWSIYYQLIQEMTDLQQQNKKADWISWHQGAHLISKNPQGSKTFEYVVHRLCTYFGISSKTVSTRFNWYRDSSDWKPMHHDSAAFNPHRARSQNITVGASFGATRELAFLRASDSDSDNNDQQVRLYFPQTNNGCFSFGRDANIRWKHGVNALPPEEQDGKGRISIILWGLAEDVVEENDSPPLLGSDGQGPHAQKNKTNNSNRHARRNRRKGKNSK